VKKMAALMDGLEDKPEFNPPSAINADCQIGEESYIEYMFMTETQFIKYCKGSFQATGAQVYERTAEDGVTKILGTYVSFSDMPSDISLTELLSIRKVKFYSRVGTQWLEHLLLPENQIRQQQGKDNFTVVEGKRRKHQVAKPSYMPYVPTVSDLRVKAAKSAEARKKKEAEIVARLQGLVPGDTQPDSSDASGSEDCNDEEEAKILKMVASRFAMGSAASASVTTAASSAKPRKGVAVAANAPGRKSAGSAKSSAGAESVLSRGKSKTILTEDMRDVDIRDAIGHDSLLLKVALRIGSVPDCFLMLQPEKIFQNLKIGNQVFSVSSLFIPKQPSTCLV
jgi:hypothetical protein